MDIKTREKKIIALCAVVGLAAALNFAAVAPSVAKRDKLEKSIRKTQMNLADLRALESEYGRILGDLEKITRQTGGTSRNFDMGSFLTRTADKLELGGALTWKTRQRRQLAEGLTENLVDVKLKSVSLESLVAFLFEIEQKGAAVAIAKITVKPESKTSGLNVTMLVTSISSR
jgi:type II secretory pathway component PulM